MCATSEWWLLLARGEILYRFFYGDLVIVADVPCLLRHILRFLKTSPFKNLKNVLIDLHGKSLSSRSFWVIYDHVMGSTLENLTLQHCVWMWEATPHAKICLLNSHTGSKNTRTSRIWGLF